MFEACKASKSAGAIPTPFGRARPEDIFKAAFIASGSSLKYFNKLKANPRHTSSPCFSCGKQLTAEYKCELGDTVTHGYDWKPATLNMCTSILELFRVEFPVVEGP